MRKSKGGRLADMGLGPVSDAPVLACVKVPYESEGEALRASKGYTCVTLPLRAYRCGTCGKWHLTHNDKRTKQR
jgi:hypothetical protein